MGTRVGMPGGWALFVLAAGLAAGPAWGAVTVYGTPAAATTGSGGGTSLVINFTVPTNGATFSGTFECYNPALVVGISILRNAGSAPAVTSVVWDPDPPGGSTYALQLQDATAGNTDQSGDSRRKRTEMWLLTTQVPSALGTIPSGAGRIVITWGTSAQMVAGAVMTCAVDQASPRRGGTFGDPGGTADTSAEVGVAVLNTGLAIDVLAVEGNISVTSATPTRTNAWNIATGSSSTTLRGYASTYPIPAAPPTISFQNLQYTLSASDHWGLAALSLRPSGVTAEGVSEFAAAPAGGGVELSWRAGWDANTLGYRIWRERGGERSLITPEVIAGSFLAHGRERLEAGHSFAWRDDGGRPGDLYLLERLGLDGRTEVVASARSSGRELRRTLRPSSPTLGAVAAAVAPPARVRPYIPGSTPAGNGPESEATQFWLAGQPAVKIGVREAGWYRIPALDLVAAGMPLEVAALPRLRLFADAQEVAMRVTPGRSGQRLDADSAIEFWGEGLDSPHADARVYWLVLDGRLGRRIAEPAAGVLGGGELGVFASRVEVRERLAYVPAVRNGEDENFFGRLLAAGKDVTFALSTPHLAPAPSSRATLELALQGLSEGEHRVAVQLNGTPLGTVSGSGSSPFKASFIVSPETLRSTAANELVLTNQSGEKIVSIVDTVALTYPRLTRAVGNELHIPSVTWPAGGLLLGGFEQAGARVFDVTDPRNPVELAVRPVSDGSTHGVAVQARGGLRTHTALYAAAPEQLRRPAFLRLNRPSQLHAVGNAADFIVVAGEGLDGALAPLVEARRRQGLATMVVEVEDVFDEFSGGSVNPWALRRFFQRAATSWQGKPSYVLLAGDGSYDPRDYLGRGGNLVPVALVDTELFETASDDWFVDFDGDGVGELAIGRLPASGKDELAVMVDKLLRYEAAQRQPLRALLVADEPLLEAFFEVNQLLVGQLPAGSTTDHIDVEREGVAPARARLLAELARGWDLVHYSGHGTVDRWRNGVLRASDAPLLPVTAQPWVLTMANCLSGIFQEPLLAGLGEQLLRAPGGAALVWASTGSTPAPAQERLLAAFLAGAYGAPTARVGDAVRAAKAAVSNSDVRLTWVLLGDPTMRLR